MFKVITLLSLVVGISHSLLSSNPIYPISAIAEDLLVDANAIIRNYETTFVVKNEGNAVKTIKKTISILNKKGDDENILQVPYSQQIKITTFKGTLLDHNGKVLKKLKNSDITDFSANIYQDDYSDSRVKAAQLAHNEYPYTVSYEYELSYKNFSMFYPTWVPQNAPHIAVEKATLTMDLPQQQQLRYHIKNSDIDAQKQTVKNRQVFTFKLRNLAPKKQEPYAPNLYDIYPMVLTGPVSFELYEVKGNMQNWDMLGSFYYQLNYNRNALSAATKRDIHQLTKNARTPQEKIALLYGHLQKNTRYVSVQLGIGGWQTFPAEYVETNKYGDCKALTNYMQAMLQEINITSYPALVNSGVNVPDVTPEFCSSQFNHVFLCVPLVTDTIWLECTSAYSPPNYCSNFTDNRNVLLVKPKNSQIIRTPSSAAKSNANHYKATITLSNEAHLSAQISQTLIGLQQDEPRYIAKSQAPNKQKMWLNDYIDIKGSQLKSYEFTHISPTIPTISLTYDLESKIYATKSGSRIFFKPFIGNKLSQVPDNNNNRQHSVVIQRPKSYTDTLVYQLPEGYKIENLPKSATTIDSDFGIYQQSISLDNNQTLTCIRHFETKKVHLPAERYQDLRQFISTIKKADNIKLVLKLIE